MKTANRTLSVLLCLLVSPAAILSQTSSAPALPDAPSTTEHDEPPAVPTGPTVLFDTSMGRLTCQLFSKEAPNTVANFVGLATGAKTWTDPETSKKVTGQPFYDGTTFHRVIPNFMIQGGDRLGSGMGDAGYYFDDEISPALRFDVPGRLAMANSGPNTNGSQFFITEDPVPQLNGKYNIFGQCDPHSVLVVSSIARVERNADDKPITPVVINKVTIIPAGQPVPPLPDAAAAPAPSAAPSASGPAPAGATPRNPPPAAETR
jgi:peptidyl-prolyl cis-trans isomerase A (cyclophilin A)